MKIKESDLNAAPDNLKELNVNFEKYKKAGLTPKGKKSIDDIHKIPVTNKDDLKESLDLLHGQELVP